jgi:zinc protease
MGTGSFEINTFARNEKVGEAIKSTMEVVREFQHSGIKEEELKAAKALLVGQFPAAIETADRLAYNLLILRVYGVPDSYLTDFFQNVNSIRLKDVNDAIHQHFNPEKFKVVVYADGKAVEKQLSDVGPFEIQKIQ